MKGGKTPLYMSQQFLYLIYIAQINCKDYVDNRVEGIYLEKVVSCAAMSSQVVFFGAFL